jgi:hypothetical protein
MTSALVGIEWSASRPGRFTPGEKAPDSHWIGVWVGAKIGPDDVEKRKILTLTGLELLTLLSSRIEGKYPGHILHILALSIEAHPAFPHSVQ